jgi:hypothetical protein
VKDREDLETEVQNIKSDSETITSAHEPPAYSYETFLKEHEALMERALAMPEIQEWLTKDIRTLALLSISGYLREIVQFLRKIRVPSMFLRHSM